MTDVTSSRVEVSGRAQEEAHSVGGMWMRRKVLSSSPSSSQRCWVERSWDSGNESRDLERQGEEGGSISMQKHQYAGYQFSLRMS